MIRLEGEHLYLRALEAEDLDFLFEVENDLSFWEISNTIVPYSKYLLQQYLDNSHKDIFEAKQLRLVICSKNDQVIGFIDLFDFDFKNKRAGVGLLVKEEAFRQKGFGKEALEVLTGYAKDHLGLHQLYCNISESNEASLKLFQKVEFTIVGLKKDWNLVNGQFKNEYILQRILH